MTHDRTQQITGLFERWLERFTPPQGMRGNTDAMADEKMSLLRLLLKHAPPDDFGTFVADALMHCEHGMKTRAWPTVFELRSACRDILKQSLPVAGSSAKPTDSAELTAARMHRGEAVGEAWLYGILACEMIARGLIDQDTMRKYRSAAYFNRKDVYGEESARRWQAEAEDGHERAKLVWRDRNNRKKQNVGNLAETVRFPGADLVDF